MRGGARPGDEGGAAAPPFCAVSAPPQPVCEVGPLGGHRAPSAGKTQHRAQQIRAADRGALHPGAFWTAPAPCRLDGARLRRILDRPTRKMLHPVVEAALPPPRPIASGQATTYWGRQIAYPNAQFPTPMPGPGTDGVHPAQQRPPRDAEEDRKRGGGRPRTPGPGALGRSRRPGAGAGGRRGYPGSSCSTVREPHDAGLVRIQRLPLPGVRPRSPVWRSKMRLSSRLERGLVERMVQNASESARIRPDPAQIAKLRRILDHPRAVPPGWGETQTGFGPPPPGARRFTQL